MSRSQPMKGKITKSGAVQLTMSFEQAAILYDMANQHAIEHCGEQDRLTHAAEICARENVSYGIYYGLKQFSEAFDTLLDSED